MKTIRWRHLWREGGGVELLELGTGHARGRIMAEGGDDAFDLDYHVGWDDARSHTLVVGFRAGERLRSLTLFATAGGWTVEGVARPDLDGCLDVDLWPTPFTNTLAIRRILAAGRTAATIRVAWVDGIEGTVAAREQRYTQLAPGRWRFESLDDGFSAELAVDEEGLVVDYPELFART